MTTRLLATGLGARVVAVVLSALTAWSAGGMPAWSTGGMPVASTPGAEGRLPPVPGAPVRPFVAPVHEYGPGHRGVDLPAVAGDVVRAPTAGTVTFSGPVAGRGVVVVAHPGGVLTSLEPVRAGLPRGTPVRAGDPVAVLSEAPAHAGCPGTCLHWGVRVEGRYVDPWWWLGRTRPVRLLPWTGSAPGSSRGATPGSAPQGSASAAGDLQQGGGPGDLVADQQEGARVRESGPSWSRESPWFSVTTWAHPREVYAATASGSGPRGQREDVRDGRGADVHHGEGVRLLQPHPRRAERVTTTLRQPSGPSDRGRSRTARPRRPRAGWARPW